MIFAMLFCFAFPCLLIYAAWSDVRSMTINNWVSIVLAAAFVPAAAASGMSLQQFGSHLGFAAIALLIGAVLFYLNVFGGGDAKVIAAASIWLFYLAMRRLTGTKAALSASLLLAALWRPQNRSISPPARRPSPGCCPRSRRCSTGDRMSRLTPAAGSRPCLPPRSSAIASRRVSTSRCRSFCGSG